VSKTQVLFKSGQALYSVTAGLKKDLWPLSMITFQK